MTALSRCWSRSSSNCSYRTTASSVTRTQSCTSLWPAGLRGPAECRSDENMNFPQNFTQALEIKRSRLAAGRSSIPVAAGSAVARLPGGHAATSAGVSRGRRGPSRDPELSRAAAHEWRAERDGDRQHRRGRGLRRWLGQCALARAGERHPAKGPGGDLCTDRLNSAAGAHVSAVARWGPGAGHGADPGGQGGAGREQSLCAHRRIL